MANEEHLDILNIGVITWNEWRRDNPGIKVDLSGVDLSGASLTGMGFLRADLSEANLSEANISRTSFINANLSGADLSQAFIRGANFLRADLSEANLSNASLVTSDLIEANFSGADFSDAKLDTVNLSGADFSEAFMGYTVLADIDLSQVKGLKNIRHFAPSTIGIDTIYRSGGNIPESFLRACGVPDTFITFTKSLVGKAIKFYSAFISFSSRDDDLALRIYADLQAKDIRCWLAPEDLKIGDKFRLAIEDSIRLHDKLLLILSEQSIASKWVKYEVENALDREVEQDKLILFPIRIDDAVMETDVKWATRIKSTRHIGDFTEWKDHDSYQKALDRLMRDLQAEES